ncbi:MAG: hypothetical protein Q4E16_03380 [Neisseria sp.]|nr:hypothetical protein [Neisseria sp.]
MKIIHKVVKMVHKGYENRSPKPVIEPVNKNQSMNLEDCDGENSPYAPADFSRDDFSPNGFADENENANSKEPKPLAKIRPPPFL